MNNLIKELEILPVLLVEALVEHRFFDAFNLKRKKLELENWFRMNSFESKYTMEEDNEDTDRSTE